MYFSFSVFLLFFTFCLFASYLIFCFLSLKIKVNELWKKQETVARNIQLLKRSQREEKSKR